MPRTTPTPTIQAPTKPPKKRISTSSAKAKGRRLQQWVAKKISTLTGIPWGQDELIGSRPMGQSGVDIILIGEAKKTCPISFECKAQESWSVPAFIKQAKKNMMPDTEWCLIMKRSNEKPVAVVDAEYFIKLAIENIQLKRQAVLGGIDTY